MGYGLGKLRPWTEEHRESGGRGFSRVERPGLGSVAATLLTLASLACLAAVVLLWRGTASVESSVAAQLYVIFFGFLALGLPTLAWTARKAGAGQIWLPLLSAAGGAILLAWATRAWTRGDYCGASNIMTFRHLYGRLPPNVFRCRSLPLDLVGALAGWWAMVGLIGRSRSRET